MTRHCHQCGLEWKLTGQPGRSETCPRCSSDLRVCLNCTYYDPKVACQCQERRADPVAEKHLANYCEYFDLVRRPFVAKREENARESSAREQLKKLLGD